MQAVLIGILSSLFYSATFLFNRAMNVSGASWAWTGALRFLFALPVLLLFVLLRKNFKPLWHEMRQHPGAWFLWGTFGGIGFYAMLSFAAVYGPAWLVAGTWQITILAGSLLAPLFGSKIPYKSLKISALILVGVILMQVAEAGDLSLKSFLLGFVPVLVAAFLFPLGNRKLMNLCEGRLDTFQRVLGMVIASLPVCLLLAFYGVATTGWPTGSQTVQGVFLALFSGVFATVLFFFATDLAKGQMQLLALVESTQAGSIIFTVLGEVLLLGGSMPVGSALIGSVIIVVGMVMNSLLAGRQKKPLGA